MPYVKNGRERIRDLGLPTRVYGDRVRSLQLCGFSPRAVNSLGPGGRIRYRGVAKSWLAHDQGFISLVFGKVSCQRELNFFFFSKEWDIIEVRCYVTSHAIAFSLYEAHLEPVKAQSWKQSGCSQPFWFFLSKRVLFAIAYLSPDVKYKNTRSSVFQNFIKVATQVYLYYIHNVNKIQ